MEAVLLRQRGKRLGDKPFIMTFAPRAVLYYFCRASFD